MNDLDQANKNKDELEEKIRLLTLASEEKQVNATFSRYIVCSLVKIAN